ncbi:MAG TPA: substrate-binding domain-containing protein [Solirubrobacterales bacterium]|nr:substrate-binding domain-containing protein [Solirubrobacterales bacterium]
MRRRAQLIAALFCLAIIATGCGVSQQTENKNEGETQNVSQEGPAQKKMKLPPRPAGEIRISGATDSVPTEALLQSYEETTASTTLAVNESDEGEAFNSFCQGGTDIVASTRPISRAEFETCRQRNVQPVQIQLASDAAVLAIHNETNVGVDCLTLGEVHEIFRAGSPITNWSQVDFISPGTESSAPDVTTTGPDAESDLFEFFSSIVLGIDLPSLASVRGDYIPHAEPRGVRLQVTGGTGRRQHLAERAKGTAEVLKGQLEALKGAEAFVKEAKFQVNKGIRDKRDAEEKAKDKKTLEEAEEKLARIEKRLPPIRKQLRLEVREGHRLNRSLGTLGIFGFTYYEVWEEQLRPMEIDTRPADAKQPNCIFPSTQTVSEATYPLARQILLTVSTQRLKEAEIRSFLHYMVVNSESAANELGIVPLSSERRDEELSWIAGESAPEVIFYPVTTTPATAQTEAEAEAENNAG